MQDVEGSMRSHWASGMGWIIYSVSEVDMMLIHFYGFITQQKRPIKLPNKWQKLTTSDRLKLVEAGLYKMPESPATLRIKRIFARVKVLMDNRNHIAHGVLAFVRGGQMEMIRYDKKTDQMVTMTYAELRKTEKTARKLSDDISLLIHLCETYDDFIRPYAPGEVQGMEEIKPHDPAPAAS